MNFAEAYAALKSMVPGQTVCLAANAWNSYYSDGKHRERVEYRASIFNGELLIYQKESLSLDALISDARMNLQPAEPPDLQAVGAGIDAVAQG